jgi:cell division protein FtsQ
MADTSRGEAGRRAAVVALPRRSALPTLARVTPSLRSLVVGFALLAFAVGMYAASRETSLFAIQRIEVAGGPPAVAARVEQALAPLEGTSLVSFRTSELDRRVATLPDVVTASADRAFPHTLVVFIRAERPLAVLRRGAESWLLSARGRVLRPLARGARPNLSRVWVAKSVELSTGAIVVDRGTLRAVRTLREVEQANLGARVRSVALGPGRTTLILDSGLELRLGAETDVALKLAAAGEVLPLLGPADAPGTRYVDLSVPARPVSGYETKSQAEIERSE